MRLSIRIGEQLLRQAYWKHRQHLRWRAGDKDKDFDKHFDKDFVKNIRKKCLAGKHLEFFLLYTLKTLYWMEYLTQRWTQSGPFFPKSGHFFRFSKKRGCCALVSVAEYVSIFLNISKCPWKWLNKLFWPCQGSEYAWSSYIFDKLLIPWVLNVPRFLT